MNEQTNTVNLRFPVATSASASAHRRAARRFPASSPLLTISLGFSEF